MEITPHPSGEVLELRISGRLDAYWADHLTAALNDAVRGGARHLRLNMAEVSFLSSAGIRVLLQFWRQLHGISGSFSITYPSDAVTTVLELAGFDELLTSQPETAEEERERVRPSGPTSRRIVRDALTIELFDVAPGATVRCSPVGNGELLLGCRFDAGSAHAVDLGENAFTLGVAALGERFEECRGRFGELLSAAGATAYLPTDGTNVPDYLLTTGGQAPKIQMLYGLLCEGRLPLLGRFEAPAGGTVRLSDLATACLDLGESPAVAIVAVAETAGLVGAALRKPPVAAAAGGVDGSGAPFSHPQIRDWLSFTGDRAHAHGLAMVVGIAARQPSNELLPLLRPFGGASSDQGHFHAAVFTYRPLPSGTLDLKQTVASVFEGEKLLDVLHLLNDDRPTSGVGESEFVQGACWFGPITPGTTARS